MLKSKPEPAPTIMRAVDRDIYHANIVHALNGQYWLDGNVLFVGSIKVFMVFIDVCFKLSLGNKDLHDT